MDFITPNNALPKLVCLNEILKYARKISAPFFYT